MRDDAHEKHGTDEVIVICRDSACLVVDGEEKSDGSDQLLIWRGVQERFDGVDEFQVKYMFLLGFSIPFLVVPVYFYFVEEQAEGEDKWNYGTC